MTPARSMAITFPRSSHAFLMVVCFRFECKIRQMAACQVTAHMSFGNKKSVDYPHPESRRSAGLEINLLPWNSEPGNDEERGDGLSFVSSLALPGAGGCRHHRN